MLNTPTSPGPSSNANRQVGTLVGIAVMSVVLTTITDWNCGPAVSFLVIGIAYLAAALGAWLSLGSITYHFATQGT